MSAYIDPSDPVYCVLLNGWLDYHVTDPAYPTVGFIREADGRVWLRGGIKSGASSTVALVLPADFRPLYRVAASTYADNGVTANVALVQLDTNGSVSVYSAGTNFVNLNGLSFDTRR